MAGHTHLQPIVMKLKATRMHGFTSSGSFPVYALAVMMCGLNLIFSAILSLELSWCKKGQSFNSRVRPPWRAGKYLLCIGCDKPQKCMQDKHL